MRQQSTAVPLLGTGGNHQQRRWSRALFLFGSLMVIILIWCISLGGEFRLGREEKDIRRIENGEIVESPEAVVAADDARCSEIGASVLKKGGHAVDAAVATCLCLGVVNPMGSGIGGGGFMIVRLSATFQAEALDMRETAPLAASQNMYERDPVSKYIGPLSMGVPGEVAGLYEAWSKYGRLPWNTLFEPAIKLAKDGFVVAPYLAKSIVSSAKKIQNDPGLRQVYSPNGKLLRAGDICRNVELGLSLEAIAEQGPQALYDGLIGEKLVKDVREAGGILTMEDLRNYKVDVINAMAVNTMGYTILGMPAPSGTLGLSLVLNILDSYGGSNGAKGSTGLHRLIEAFKHMFALRMNLGDPNFVNISNTVLKMLSPAFAKKIQQRIYDNTTFPPEYYMHSWSQLRDHGTSHVCIVDTERNAVSMTTTINYGFGGGVLSPSTGIILNNEMDDFSTPTEQSPDKLPPTPSNFIMPKKRPLSSMTPIVITKDGQLAGVIGCGGGLYIIPAVVQVFLNHFVFGMEPLAAVEAPRVYHKLIPNVVLYENWTVIDGEHIEVPEDKRKFLEERGHEVESKSGGANCQLVVQTLKTPAWTNRVTLKVFDNVVRGMLTAVSDPRKDGRPAGI